MNNIGIWVIFVNEFAEHKQKRPSISAKPLIYMVYPRGNATTVIIILYI